MPEVVVVSDRIKSEKGNYLKWKGVHTSLNLSTLKLEDESVVRVACGM